MGNGVAVAVVAMTTVQKSVAVNYSRERNRSKLKHAANRV